MILKKNGVHLISVMEPIAEGSQGILVETLLEGMAEYYSAELSEKVIRGQTENTLKGKCTGGTGTIGYKIDDAKFYHLDPLTAPLVLEAFQRYDNGDKMVEIVNSVSYTHLDVYKRQVMDRGQLVGMLGTLHFMGSVGQRREEHGLCGICGKQQSTALAVHDLCPAHSGLCTALLRHKVLCHVVCDLVLVNAQLCTMLTIPVGLRRAVSVPLHRVVIGVDLEQYADCLLYTSRCV